MFDWFDDHPGPLIALGVASLVVFVGSLVAVPAIAVRIPADYFTHSKRPPGRWQNLPPALRWTLRIGKNVLGVVLVIAGLAMLALPGQGLLTLILGVLLIEGPGKYRFEKWLVRRRWVHRPINWLRRKRGREPLRLDDPRSGSK
ncbi:MAG: hypothetical protein IT430_04600 [Phycisphaerales bacterium]|nr:hypothetical protein [Phycisphaerales bacterium]